MLDKWIPRILAAAIVSSLVSIFLSEVFFGLTCLLWLADSAKRGKLRVQWPPFTRYLVFFVGSVMLAILFSADVIISTGYLKKFIKFLYILWIFTYLDRKQVERTGIAIYLVLGISALLGVLQYFWLMEVDLLNRIQGFMSHWMTFSGQLMIGSVALCAYLLFDRLPELLSRMRSGREPGRPALGLAAGAALLLLFLFALVLTSTRSAWLGTIAGLFVLLWFFRTRLVIAGSALLIVLFLALPLQFKERFYSSFDLNDTTTRIRLELFATARNIIGVYPCCGLGPRMVPLLYRDYNTTDEFPGWIYQHLHNNVLHIWAEMGLVTLLAWLSLWLRLMVDFFRFGRKGGSDWFLSSSALGGIGVIGAFLAAGLFEYNFGDSEVLILLLFFITGPYVVYRQRQESA